MANCRNAQEIGRLLRRRLGGAPAPARGPLANDLRFVPVGSADGDADPALPTAVDAVPREVDALVLDGERDAGELAVLTFTTTMRDQLVDQLGLVRWEDRDQGTCCENVHRVKGLEFDTVILVADTEVPDPLLYVGISRAVSELIIVAPPAVGDRLGLTAG